MCMLSARGGLDQSLDFLQTQLRAELYAARDEVQSLERCLAEQLQVAS